MTVGDNDPMQVNCKACGAPSELDRLDAVDGGFGFVCAQCGASNVLAPVGAPAAETAAAAETPSPAAAPRASKPPAPAPAPLTERRPPPGYVECPKCGHHQPSGSDACHRCGLLFAYAATGRARLPGDPLAGHPAARTIRARWEALSADLDDVEGHRDFIRLCAETNLLEYAGQCYRLLGDAHPDDPRVAALRQRVLAAAMAQVGRIEQRAADVDRTRVRRLLVLLVAAFLLACMAFGYYLLSRYQLARQFEV